MYQNTVAEIRPDLMTYVQEAMGANAFFIASQVFPLYGSPTKNGEYRRIKKGSGNLLQMSDPNFTLRAPRTPYKQVDRTFEKDGFLCQDRGLEEAVDDTVEADLIRYFSAEKVAVDATLANILRGQERRVADIVMDPDVWGSLEVNLPWIPANRDTVTIPDDIKSLKRAIKKRGEVADTMVLTEEVWDFLTTTKSLREYFFGTQAGGVSIDIQMFAAKFGFRQILLGDAIYSTADAGVEPAANQLENIWDKTKLWIGSVKGGAPEAGGAGRIFYWEEDCESEYVIESYREEKIRSDMVRVRQHGVEKVINENAGLVLETGFEE